MRRRGSSPRDRWGFRIYAVELTVGGKTVQQPLIVKLDPRVHATPTDLEAQLALARRILSGVATSYADWGL
jgi:hypothetical protein